MDFLAFRSWFDQRFARVLEQKIETFAALSNNPLVTEVVRYTGEIAKDGKRFRPYVLFLGCDQNTSEEYVSLYAAAEMLHIFALVHDDIMDKATTRHGVPCVHEKFKTIFGADGAQSAAILLGDIVFSWGYELLADMEKVVPDRIDAMRTEFQTLIAEVIHGQMLDVFFQSNDMQSFESIVQKMELKTARYSFMRPLTLGLITSGADVETIADAKQFATALGIGFQIQDDLLDSKPQALTGKTAFTDIRTRQQTVLSWYMTNKAEQVYKDRFMSYWGVDTLTAEDEQVIFEILEHSGAFAYAQTLAGSYFEQARTAIADKYPSWLDLIDVVMSRTK